MLSLEQKRIVEPRGRKGKGGEGNRQKTERGKGKGERRSCMGDIKMVHTS